MAIVQNTSQQPWGPVARYPVAIVQLFGEGGSTVRSKFHLLRRRDLNATRIVAGSFAVIILLGTVLLNLPEASRSGQSPGLLTCLFTSTSSTCVTGLVLVDTATQWSMFGQAVILGLIQLGGLGFISIMTLFSMLLRRKIGLSERLLLVSNFNLNSISGVVRLVRFALKWTFLFELSGALILMTRFIPLYGIGQGIWLSVFHAVSAFCNAGFDLLGQGAPFQSLAPFAGDPVVLCTIMALIVIGGLGFFVWSDLADRRYSHGRLSLYTKIVLTMTAVLLAVGAGIVLAVEYYNPDTLGPMPLWQKIMNALFQSVTFRTAGFGVVNQGAFRDVTLALGCVLMLIGGSSGSTAGGIKTGTVAVLGLGLWSDLKGRANLVIGERSISRRQQSNAMTLTMTAVLLFLGGSMFLSLWDGLPFMEASFEVASALGTVGLTTGLTPTLSQAGRVLIITLMYLGRVGILSFSIAFASRSHRAEDKIKYPTTNVMIG